MPIYRLEPDRPAHTAGDADGRQELSVAILRQDARWFTQIRWGVITVLAAGAALAQGWPHVFKTVGLHLPSACLWPVAMALIVTNAMAIRHLRQLTSDGVRPRVERNLWFQIVTDLIMLSALVYLTGPVATVLPCAYLFHIALACIFFARRQSLVVLLLSAGLYLAVTGADMAFPGIQPELTVRTDDAADVLLGRFLPTIGIWFGVWYLVSTLSAMVRQRDGELERANQLLRQADAEKNRQVLRVTHDLKAPFAGIENNIQILKIEHWETIPEPVQGIINRIAAKSEILRERISSILLLGRLRAETGGPLAQDTVNLGNLLNAVIGELDELARQHRITISTDCPPDTVITTDTRQLGMMLQNLIANALHYSHEGGRIEVSVQPGPESTRVRVTDHGIGIRADALPHIFDDYYHTPEAATHNSRTTGLGLAIVRQAASNLGLTIQVESTSGAGSTFDILLPDGATS